LGALLLSVVAVRLLVNVMLRFFLVPCVPSVLLGPFGMTAAVVTVPITCSMRSPGLTVAPPAAAEVQPVRVVAPTPVQVMTVDGEGVGDWVMSTKAPATSCSRVLAWPVVFTVIVAPAPPVVGTDVPAVAVASGSRPTCSVAGSPASGLEAVGVRVWTSRPTPSLSPDGRLRV
jgi:hypothetical protein